MFNVREWKLHQEVIDYVKAFVFFVGYPRNSNVIITGSILDAHLLDIIYHKLHFFRNLLHIFKKRYLDKQAQISTVKYSVKAAMQGESRQHKSL